MATKDNEQVSNGVYRNQRLTYDSFNGTEEKKKRETHFLWWCAGAYQELLKDCPSEHSKYAGLGGVVLATFVLARPTNESGPVWSAMTPTLMGSPSGIGDAVMIFSLGSQVLRLLEATPSNAA